jgi:hypothetical protein
MDLIQEVPLPRLGVAGFVKLPRGVTILGVVASEAAELFLAVRSKAEPGGVETRWFGSIAAPGGMEDGARYIGCATIRGGTWYVFELAGP